VGRKFAVLSVRLHLRALLARRIGALDASGYLRDATLVPTVSRALNLLGDPDRMKG
jgi:hypothetical protein